MKLVYVIAQGHSGSTLVDCILGTHPDFISSGELRYLNWQLYRTMDKTATAKSQDICTCINDFRSCPFWSKVFLKLKQKTGNDLVADPTSFDISYFNQFAYKDRNGFKRSLIDRIKAYVTREWCEQGWHYTKLPVLSTDLNRWLRNNWILYESMSEVGNKPVVVDSSKHLMIALLLQQYQPKKVTLLFLHRSVKALAASTKRRAKRIGQKMDLKSVVKAKQHFENRVVKYKRNIKNLQYFDVKYEEMVGEPSTFLEKLVRTLGASIAYNKQDNNSFYIDPTQQHLVAGNPMRYRGRQKVRYDARWKQELTKEEIEYIHSKYPHN